jgi:hypothetical protein
MVRVLELCAARLLRRVRLEPLLAADRRPGGVDRGGALDDPTGLRTERHIFVAHKGDWYEIADGLPQFPDSSPGAGGGG